MDDIVSYNDWLSPMMRNEYAFLWIDDSVGTHICFKALLELVSVYFGVGLSLFWSSFKSYVTFI